MKKYVVVIFIVDLHARMLVKKMKNNLPVAVLGLVVGSVMGYLISQVVKTKEDDLIWNINDRYEKVLLLVSIVVILLLVLVVVVYAGK